MPHQPFRGRHQGFQRARRFYVCVNCRKDKEAPKKPGFCEKCGQTEFWKMDSYVEFLRFRELEIQWKAEYISNLDVHKRWPLVALDRFGKPAVIGYYVDDFNYTDNRGIFTVEDVKPKDPRAQTDLFKWKVRHFEAQYHQQITIIAKG